MSGPNPRSEEHTSELQSPCNLVCRLLLEKKKRDSNLSLVSPAGGVLIVLLSCASARALAQACHPAPELDLLHSLIICPVSFFFFNDTATTEIYTLSLHDALPILCRYEGDQRSLCRHVRAGVWFARSEEHTSELQSPCNLVCRLLLEKKHTSQNMLIPDRTLLFLCHRAIIRSALDEALLKQQLANQSGVEVSSFFF